MALAFKELTLQGGERGLASLSLPQGMGLEAGKLLLWSCQLYGWPHLYLSGPQFIYLYKKVWVVAFSIRFLQALTLLKIMSDLAGVAQWTECWPTNQRVAGSIPSQGTCLG